MTLHRILRIFFTFGFSRDSTVMYKHVNSTECVHKSAQMHQRLSESQDRGAVTESRTPRDKTLLIMCRPCGNIVATSSQSNAIRKNTSFLQPTSSYRFILIISSKDAASTRTAAAKVVHYASDILGWRYILEKL